ncbi:DUF4251 domain-containing protein [Aquimarina agarilytica]|uniref:DUF4251 domain-containing protein n=1 Tax=Aquimarina agarilytica TaxID=1087449 RepID=UPI000289C0B3|nr:DUF4251 domain-containing protein [Aquimarina agarilytica]
MNYLFKLLIISSFIGVVSCKSSEVTNQKKADQFVKLQELIESKSYQIDINAIYPFNTAATTQVLNNILFQTGNSAARIDVRGNGNYIKISDDKVKANLAFFGERQISGNYGRTDGGIQLDDSVQKYTVTKNDKKKTLSIKFNANDGIENFSVTIIASINMRVSIGVNSSHLNRISYDGTIETLEEGFNDL